MDRMDKDQDMTESTPRVLPDLAAEIAAPPSGECSSQGRARPAPPLQGHGEGCPSDLRLRPVPGYPVPEPMGTAYPVRAERGGRGVSPGSPGA